MIWRWPFRLMLSFVLFLIVLGGFGAWLFTRTSLLEQQVNAWLDNFLSAQLPLVTTIGDIGGETWRELTLRDIRVDEIAGDSLIPLLHIDSVRLDYRWRELIGRRWHVDSLSITGVRLLLRDSADGQLHRPWKSTAKTPAPAVALPLMSIDQILVTQVDIVRKGADTTRIAAKRLSGALQISKDRLTTTVVIQDFDLEGKRTFKADTLFAQLIGFGQEWFVERLYLGIDSSRIFGSGQFTLGASPAVLATVACSPLRWSDVSRLAGVDLEGQGDLVAEIRFADGDLSGRGTVLGDIFGRHLEGLAYSLRVRDGNIAFDTLHGTALGASLAGRGYLNVAARPVSYGLDGDVSDFDLSRLAQGTVSTELSGHFSVAGRGLSNEELRIDVTTPGATGRLAAIEFDSAAGTLHATTDTLTLDPGFRASYLGMDARFDGYVAYSGDLYLAGVADIPSVTRVIDFLEYAGAGGTARGRFALTGSTPDPTLGFDLELTTPSFRGAEAETGHVRAHLERAFSKATGVVEGRAGGVDLWGVPVDSVQSIVYMSDEGLSVAPLTIHRGADSLRADARLALPGRSLTVTDMQATFMGRQIRIPWPAEFGVGVDTLWIHNASLLFDSGSVTINGWVGYDGPLDLQIVTANADIAPWVRLVYTEDSLSGTLFADLQLQGNVDEPTVDYRLRLRDATYRGFRLGDITSGGRILSDGARIDSLVLSSGVAHFSAHGYLPLLRRGLRLELDREHALEGQVSVDGSGLRIISLFLPDVESVRGDLEGLVKVSGTLEEPHFEGHVSLWQGDIKLWPLREHFAPAEIDISLEDSVATIRQARLVPQARKRGGDITAGGRMVFRDVTTIDYDLWIRGRDVPISYEFGDFSGRFDLDLVLEGVNPPTVGGGVRVREAVYADPFEATDSLSRAATAVSADTTAWNVNIDVNIPNNAWTKNRDVNAEWSGDLRVLRQRGEWNYLGRLEPIRGSYYFLGKRFRNLRGEIVFDDIHEADPVLALEADVNLAMARDTQSVSESSSLSFREVTVRVTGRLSAPRIEPPSWLGERNFILALNPFGNPDASSEGTFAQSAAIGAAGFLASELERFGTRTLGVETFELRPSEKGPYDLQEARLRVGTYLLPDVYIYGGSGVDPSKGTEIGFEYRLRNWLTLQGNRDYDNLYKFDLNLKWESDK